MFSGETGSRSRQGFGAYESAAWRTAATGGERRPGGPSPPGGAAVWRAVATGGSGGLAGRRHRGERRPGGPPPPGLILQHFGFAGLGSLVDLSFVGFG